MGKLSNVLNDVMNDEKTIMNFGKYKGKEIEEIICVDRKYIEWLMGQEWFKTKFEKTYNIVVNYFNPEKNENTPEHNKLQIRFLNKELPLKLTKKFYGDLYFDILRETFRYKEVIKREKVGEIKPISAEIKDLNFEIGGFDVYYRIKLLFDFEDKKEILEEGYEERYKENNYIETRISNTRYTTQFFIEIKPQIIDDFPAILRKSRQNKTRIGPDGISACYLIIAEKINPTNVSIDEIKEFFKTANIKLLTFSEIDSIPLKEGGLF